jgi:hypothetical protein
MKNGILPWPPWMATQKKARNLHGPHRPTYALNYATGRYWHIDRVGTLAPR